MVTPFNEDLQVDNEQVASLARYLTANGSDGVVVAGTTGESATLSCDEKVALFRVVREAVDDGSCVVANTGSYDTRESIELTRRAEEIGLDGIMLVVPYYNKPTQEGIYQHFKAIASATKLPVMLYNVPGRTVANILPETVKRLTHDVPNIVAIKDATSDLSQLGWMIREARPGFEVYSGEDGVTLPILSLGGVGVVSVSSHVIGNDLHQMHDLFFAGDIAGARALHLKSLPVTRALFSTSSPSPVKYALAHLGILKSARMRLPMVELSEPERRIVEDALVAYGI